jgi:hypothetical protein
MTKKATEQWQCRKTEIPLSNRESCDIYRRRAAEGKLGEVTGVDEDYSLCLDCSGPVKYKKAKPKYAEVENICQLCKKPVLSPNDLRASDGKPYRVCPDCRKKMKAKYQQKKVRAAELSSLSALENLQAVTNCHEVERN